MHAISDWSQLYEHWNAPKVEDCAWLSERVGEEKEEARIVERKCRHTKRHSCFFWKVGLAASSVWLSSSFVIIVANTRLYIHQPTMIQINENKARKDPVLDFVHEVNGALMIDQESFSIPLQPRETEKQRSSQYCLAHDCYQRSCQRYQECSSCHVGFDFIIII